MCSRNEPGAYYATLTLESVYAFEPIPDAHLLVRMNILDVYVSILL